jgi:bifunctional non-homologous end joining protein LigD
MPKVIVEGKVLELKNLEKHFWPEGYTKGDLVHYYETVAPFILPYLRNRPLVLNRYPDGIEGESFYQKECPDYAPEWVKTVPVEHRDAGKMVNYILCNDKPTLLWVVQQGAIEMHAWLARYDAIDRPDIAVLDLDPMPGVSFPQVVESASLLRAALAEFNLQGYLKTSGAEGLHIFIPVEPEYTHQEVARAMGYVADFVAKVFPKATTERVVEKRGSRVYLDCLQNGYGKTMAFTYSVRPLPGAPVSTPLDWEELEHRDWQPKDFNITTVPARLEARGDVWQGFERKQSLKILMDTVH